MSNTQKSNFYYSDKIFRNNILIIKGQKRVEHSKEKNNYWEACCMNCLWVPQDQIHVKVITKESINRWKPILEGFTKAKEHQPCWPARTLQRASIFGNNLSLQKSLSMDPAWKLWKNHYSIYEKWPYQKVIHQTSPSDMHVLHFLLVLKKLYFCTKCNHPPLFICIRV